MTLGVSKLNLLLVAVVLQIVLAMLRLGRGDDVLPFGMGSMARRAASGVTTARRASQKGQKVSARAASSDSDASTAVDTGSVMLVNPTSGDLSTITTTDLLNAVNQAIETAVADMNVQKERIDALEDTIENTLPTTYLKNGDSVRLQSKYFRDDSSLKAAGANKDLYAGTYANVGHTNVALYGGGTSTEWYIERCCGGSLYP